MYCVEQEERTMPGGRGRRASADWLVLLWLVWEELRGAVRPNIIGRSVIRIIIFATLGRQTRIGGKTRNAPCAHSLPILSAHSLPILSPPSGRQASLTGTRTK